MTWCLGDLVRVGTGAIIWRIVEFGSQVTLAEGNTDTLVHLERNDRVDVHTSAVLGRLVPIKDDNLSTVA